MAQIRVNTRRPWLDLGSKSGTVTIDASAAETQALTLSGNVTLSLTGQGVVTLVITQPAGASHTVTNASLVKLATGASFAVSGAAGSSSTAVYQAIDGQWVCEGAWESVAGTPVSTTTTTQQPSGDTTAPAWSATFTLGTPTQTSVVATASALATDNVGVTGYQVSYNGGTSWATITPSGSSFTLAGTAGTTYSATKLRAKDAAGNYSSALSVPSYTMAAEDVNAYPSATIYDTFSNAADNTSLAGSNGTTVSRRTVEKGGLLWGAWTMPLYPATSTEGETYGQVTAHINGGKLYEPSNMHARPAMLNLAQTKVLAEFDYDVTATGSRVTLSLAGSSTQAIHARLFQAEGLKVFRDGGVQLGATVALATFGGATGTIGMSYDPATGAVKVYRNGAERFTATTTTGLTGTYFGLDYTGAATIDNVRVTYL